MWKKLMLLGALGLISAVLPGSPASAQASRTWVSGVGDDANPCSRTAPCKTFSGAIAKTAPSGEIDALDPGGFGAVTITKAITIDGGGGQVASVMVAGTNGINVAAGASDVVILRNLRLQGLNTSPIGIAYTSGAQLSIANCVITGFTGSAISASTAAASELYVTDTYMTQDGNGISLTTTAASPAQLSAFLSNTRILNVGTNGVASTGSGAVNTSIVNSLIASTGTAVSAAAPGDFQVDNTALLLNNTALSAGTNALIRASRNFIVGNSTAFSGSIATDGRNRVGPTASPAPPTTFATQ